MSATADKARYFLEQSVPELKEFERKKIFSPDEISSIAKKRSDFEHKINARGSAPSDYAQYAEFEINVDTLRRKRVKRMGIKATTHNGQRRIYFVFDRGTRKFPGDVGLWMQSIQYARRQKAYKKLMQMFTNVLRLHPTKSDLWIYAAQFAVEENGDMTEARSYMQRGLRFCKTKRDIWLEYARLEMAYMAKVHARREVLGIGAEATYENNIPNEEDGDDMLRLPSLTAEDIYPDLGKTHDIDEVALRNLDNTPVMTGAIPRAIFDAAMEQFQFDGALSRSFFEMFAGFSRVPATGSVLDHVILALKSNAASNWQTEACYIMQALVGISPDDSEFPAAVRDMIQRAREAMSTMGRRSELLDWYKGWLRHQKDEDMDPALRQVISAQWLGLDSGTVGS